MAVHHRTVEGIRFETDADWRRLERAVDEGGYESPAAFAREATLRLVDEVIDDDGHLECHHDDCDRTFATVRERRGHLGSSEHALDVPDGDFWCGYCGFGPTSWRGVNAHHGSASHEGEPVRLDDQPEPDELLAPDDVPDHKNPDLLDQLYRAHDGNYTAMCRAHDFDVTPGRVRHYLIEFGIHDPTPQGPTEAGDGPRYRDPEWLQAHYDAADGNVSEMHRQLEIDVPYRTLLKNLKRLGVHDPTDPPGKRHGKGGPKPSADAETDDGEDDVGAEDSEVSGASEGASFCDLETPEWLDEGSFYTAVDMAADVDDLAATLGWADHDRLESMVDQLDVRLEGGAA